MLVHAKDLSVCSVPLEHECYRSFCRAWGIGVLNGRIRNLPIPWVLCCLIGKLSRQVCNVLIYICKTKLMYTFNTCCISKVSPCRVTTVTTHNPRYQKGCHLDIWEHVADKCPNLPQEQHGCCNLCLAGGWAGNLAGTSEYSCCSQLGYLFCSSPSCLLEDGALLLFVALFSAFSIRFSSVESSTSSSHSYASTIPQLYSDLSAILSFFW